MKHPQQELLNAIQGVENRKTKPASRGPKVKAPPQVLEKKADKIIAKAAVEPIARVVQAKRNALAARRLGMVARGQMRGSWFDWGMEDLRNAPRRKTSMVKRANKGA